MKILNFGSLNIDNVCQVPHFVRPGETLAANSFERNNSGRIPYEMRPELHCLRLRCRFRTAPVLS